MNINYKRLSNKPIIFQRMTGVTLLEFTQICSKVKPEWEIQIEDKKKGIGRYSHLRCLEDKILSLLIYYRTYITHEFIGYLFGLHNSNVCRLFKKLEPLLAKKITIKKDRSLTADKILKLLADVTEQPIQRPRRAKKRKQNYSRKKNAIPRKLSLLCKRMGK